MSAEPRAIDWIARDAAAVWHGFTQMSTYADNEPIVVARAEGHELIDVAGRRYLDAISSVWVTTLGHRVPELDAAVSRQLDRVAHSTMLGNGNLTVIELAEALSEVVPVDRPHVLFASDGSAAVEQALKIAFQYWTNRGVEGRTTYLGLGEAYHGDTVGSMSLGAGGFGVELFDPIRFEALRTPGYDDPDWSSRAAELVSARADELAAVVIEPLVQAAAGMRVADPGSFARLAEACRRHEVLLVCDEVATGFGRTGSLFASQLCGLEPDLLCLGKGLTGGYLPMSATVAADHVYQAFLGEDLGPRTLYHGHSYGGNALAAAVALRHLELLSERDVLTNVGRRSEQLASLLAPGFAPTGLIRDVRLRGLLCGVELEQFAGPLTARRVCVEAVRRGVLLRPIGDVVILVPPLSVAAEEIERIVSVLRQALLETARGAEKAAR